MKQFIQSENRNQVTLLPECLDDYISEDNPVRFINLFIDEQDMIELGVDGAEPASTGRLGHVEPTRLIALNANQKFKACQYITRKLTCGSRYFAKLQFAILNATKQLVANSQNGRLLPHR